jgi:hypothetical protein
MLLCWAKVRVLTGDNFLFNIRVSALLNVGITVQLFSNFTRI